MQDDDPLDQDDDQVEELVIRIPVTGNCYMISNGNKSGYPAKSPATGHVNLPRLSGDVSLKDKSINVIIRDLDAVVGAFALYIHQLDCIVNGVNDLGAETLCVQDCRLKDVA